MKTKKEKEEVDLQTYYVEYELEDFCRTLNPIKATVVSAIRGFVLARPWSIGYTYGVRLEVKYNNRIFIATASSLEKCHKKVFKLILEYGKDTYRA